MGGLVGVIAEWRQGWLFLNATCIGAPIPNTIQDPFQADPAVLAMILGLT